MYPRKLGEVALKLIKKLPILTITGPRQSGKTTLARSLFPDFQYYSLEDPDLRKLATKDPRSFLDPSKGSLIIDEIQNVPELTSYLQVLADDPENKNKYIITGSHSQLLVEAVSQSLVGRTQVLELLPLSYSEMKNEPSINTLSLEEYLFRGFYPAVHHKKLDPSSYYKNYFQLYVEKDLRNLFQIKNLDRFERFTSLLAGRSGQLMNYESLGTESGVTGPTVKDWLSVLRSSYIAFPLQPHFKNFNKRIVKSPKYYFYDTGLLCYLLNISQASQLLNHPLRGQIFENFIVVEFIKKTLNSGKVDKYYFWRDQKGHEIDLLIDQGNELYPIEIKLSQTPQNSFIKNIEFFNKLQSFDDGEVIYSGDNYSFKNIQYKNWREAF